MTKIWLPLVGDGKPAPLRLGIGIAHQRDHAWRDRSLALLKPPCWKDWLWDHGGKMHGYLPSIFCLYSRVEYGAALAGAGDVLWELGNEPEYATPPTQPTVAAKFVQDWQRVAGDNFAAPGIILWTLGMQWLEKYLAAGGPVGNCWNIHLYFATDADDWSRIWELWCTWQRLRGLERPTFISETNGNPGSNQAAIMTRVAQTLREDARLHTALWYSDHDLHNAFHGTDLVTAGAAALTPLGEHYRALVAGA